jgi:dGTPase
MMDWKQLLSSVRVAALMERKVPSIRPPEDVRTPFEQDYGRSAFSTPVRRLQDKAQVFPLEEHDAIRTRLTHSIEVSSVARGLGASVAKSLSGKKLIDSEQGSCIETIAATCGLIHDLGNPPFGHAGETAIGSWFAKRPAGFFSAFQPDGKYTTDEERDKAARNTQLAQDFLYFEGNAQTQRLLSRLQVLADENGLNLTAGTLSASCKYIAASHQTDRNKSKSERRQPFKKHGFFASENALIDKIREETGTGVARNPITLLVEAADDIVYATVDIEDGIKKKLLTWQQFYEELKHRCSGEVLEPIVNESEQKIDPAGFKGSSYDEAMSVAFRTFAIRQMVIGVRQTFCDNNKYESIMNGSYMQEILYDSPAGELAKACKDIAKESVYSSHVVLKREVMGRQIIHDLLDLYWEAAELTPEQKNNEFGERIFKLISPNYVHIFKKNAQNPNRQIPEQYFRMQLITDQVAGMTDTFAVSLHRELMNG